MRWLRYISFIMLIMPQGILAQTKQARVSIYWNVVEIANDRANLQLQLGLSKKTDLLLDGSLKLFFRRNPFKLYKVWGCQKVGLRRHFLKLDLGRNSCLHLYHSLRAEWWHEREYKVYEFDNNLSLAYQAVSASPFTTALYFGKRGVLLVDLGGRYAFRLPQEYSRRYTTGIRPYFEFAIGARL